MNSNLFRGFITKSTFLVVLFLLQSYVILAQVEPAASPTPPQTSSTPNQPPMPSINVTCELGSVKDNPLEDLFYAMIKFKWEAKNAQYVIIQGLDERQRPVNGEIEREGGGSFVFIVVGANGVAQKPVSCVHKYVPFPGRNGLKHSAETVTPPVNAEIAYKILFKTAVSRTEIENRLLRLLQNRGYSMGVSHPGNSPEDDLFFYTNYHYTHPELCPGDTCKNPKRERQVAFTFLIHQLVKQGDIGTYELHITPRVIFCYPVQDKNDWREDLEGRKYTVSITAALADLIEQSLK